MTDNRQLPLAVDETVTWEVVYEGVLWKARLPESHEKNKTHFAARAYIYRDSEMTPQLCTWPVPKKNAAFDPEFELTPGTTWAFTEHKHLGFTLRAVTTSAKAKKAAKAAMPATAPPSPMFAPSSPHPFSAPHSPFAIPPSTYGMSPPAVAAEVSPRSSEMEVLRRKVAEQEAKIEQLAGALGEVMQRLQALAVDDNDVIE